MIHKEIGVYKLKNLKAHQRDLLIYEFGILIQPCEELIKKDPLPTIKDYRIAIAKVFAGDRQWRKNVKEFTTFAKDIIFEKESRDTSHVPEALRRKIEKLINRPPGRDLGKLRREYFVEFDLLKEHFFMLINKIPIDWEPVIFEANTPYTSYFRPRKA